MKKNWQKTTLEKITNILSGKSRPQKKDNGKYPIYGGNGVLGFTNEYNISSKLIVVGRVGAYCGSVFFEKNNFWLSDNALGIKSNENSDLKFLYYLLANLQLNQKAIGGAQPLLTQGIIKQISILLPTLPEQKAIAKTLSSLDDKIDLLHRQNKTLEDMAQTLFRKWFVEEVDDGWEEKPLDEIANYLNGLACQKYPNENEVEKLPVLKIKELGSGITENSDWVTSKIDKKYIVEFGDVIFSWSGSLMLKIWDGQRCVLNQHLFKITSEKYPKWFYYFWTKHYLEKFIGIADSKATTMGHIKRGDLTSSLVLIPTVEELSKMNNMIVPEFEKLILNFKQIRTLEKLRDTLLPKLMSGAVRVKF